MFDRAFDCLNVMSQKGGGKPDREPYKSIADPRFEVIKLRKKFFFNDECIWENGVLSWSLSLSLEFIDQTQS